MNKNQMEETGILSEGGQPRPWLVLFIIVLAAFMDLMDICIVNVAIPSIQKNLGASNAMIQWIVAGYSLPFALLLIPGGRLGDVFGRKKMFLIGVMGFIVASGLCGISQTAIMLVGARVLQGAMAGIMIPQVLSIIQVSFPLEKRGAAVAVYGSMVGLATVCGPILGGILTQSNIYNLLWRSIFLINIPIGLIAYLGTCIMLKESKATKKLEVDSLGIIIIMIALLMLLFPLVEGREMGWPIWSYISILMSIPVFWLFVRYEAKITPNGSPLIVLRLFKQKLFSLGLLVNFFVYAGIAAFWLIFTLYFQVGLGFSAMSTGFATLPWSFGFMIACALAAKSVGRRMLRIGTFLLVAGMLGLILTINYFGLEIKVWQICLNLLIGGVGFGLIAPTLVTLIVSGVPHNDAGSASGICNAVTQLGSAVGIALIGVIYFGLLSGNSLVSSAMTNTNLQINYSTATKIALIYNVAVFSIAFALLRFFPGIVEKKQQSEIV